MKSKIKRIITIGGIITVLLTFTTGSVSACTGFTASDGDRVLVGSNEDWWNFDFNIRFFPPEEGKYGMMFFETLGTHPDGTTGMVPFAGINDQGMWFDGYATPYLLPVNSSDKPLFSDPNCYYKDNLGEYCLARCSTINEGNDIIFNYNLEGMTNTQNFVADATGNSAILEGDDVIYKEGNFQVVTNFLQTHPELGSYPCWRYSTAVSMLENMTELSVDYFTAICNATHQHRSYPTVYSWISDLKNQIIYLYHFYNYENVVVIDLKEELKKGEHYIYVPSLFEPEDNQAPDKPSTPTGPESGELREEYKYSCRKTDDPDGDRTMHLFDWGDGTNSSWLRYPYAGFSVSAYHTYEERGNYEIKVKAKDIYGKESEWSDPLQISMTKNKIITINPLILQFLENHPHLFPILRQILLYLG